MAAAGEVQQKEGMIAQLKGFERAFWMVNIMEMFERLAYYGVRVVIPIYIAQADEIGGLHFSQIDKGWIFFSWAMVQSLVPVFSGGFADRYGYKKTIAFSIVIKIIGYLMMATMTDYWGFLIGCCVLAAGTAIFKPGVQGTLVRTLNNKNSSVGWGTFYMLVNIGGFLGPPLAHFLYGWSWPVVFYGCAVIVSLNFLMLLTYKEVSAGGDQTGNTWTIAKTTFKNICQPRLALFILIMSGFWLMFMQLFDMLPNFIVDWVDSSMIVERFSLPDGMTMTTDRGRQITQEWLINANAGFIVIAVVFVSWLVAKMRRVTSIFIGILISSVGLIAAGFTMSGYFCLLGILIFSLGEMLASPKMNEYLGVIAPEGEKALYMGYANIPLAIGWAYGSWKGGEVYGTYGEKATLALNYLAEKLSITEGIVRTNAFAKLQEHMGINAADATKLLWDTYHPFEIWYQFAAYGFAAAIGIFFYSRWVKKYEKGI
ncbi:MAG: MFS transporter [candidate division Zixibacteria bacterium]|nr:MFS transporter [candidate division Zixibacteria bacterium]